MKTDEYLQQVDFEKFKSADIAKRGQLWFVDVTNEGNKKQTNFRFDSRVDAEQFLETLNYLFYQFHDDTKYSNVHLIITSILGFGVGFLIHHLLF
jgi:hypothetical protein